jgi:hypothetical protein
LLFFMAELARISGVAAGRSYRRFGKARGTIGAGAGVAKIFSGGAVFIGAGAGLTTVPTIGDTVIVGTAAAALTPRLPISYDPIGIPARALPPGTRGDVDVDVPVGFDDAATLLEPEPHIPDIPDVSTIPAVVDMPEAADIPEVDDIPDAAAVAGDVPATVIPPPS